MFKDLDSNNDGEIDREEWLAFWEQVKIAKYSEEEIRFELENIMNGKSWAHFSLKK